MGFEAKIIREVSMGEQHVRFFKHAACGAEVANICRTPGFFWTRAEPETSHQVHGRSGMLLPYDYCYYYIITIVVIITNSIPNTIDIKTIIVILTVSVLRRHNLGNRDSCCVSVTKQGVLM